MPDYGYLAFTSLGTIGFALQSGYANLRDIEVRTQGHRGDSLQNAH